MTRIDGRTNDELRPVTIERGFIAQQPRAACSIARAATAVLVTAQIAEIGPAVPGGQGRSAG